MKTIAVEQYGGPEMLRFTELPEPKLGPDQVLIRVKSAGVNPVDWKVAAGYLDPVLNVSFPLIPGWDVSGVVEQVGPAVPEYAVGDEVFGYVRKDEIQHGTFAELVSAPVRTLARKPAALDWHQAAGLPLAGLTAYQSLKRAQTAKGETVLVHAAAGGVGSSAVQIAVAQGLQVIGTASERNHDFLRDLGAEPVAYGDGLADRVRALTPHGVDLALDFIGEGDAVAVSQQVSNSPERTVSIADPGVAAAGGIYHFVRPDAADLSELARLADAGALTVHVDATLPLSDAAEAFRLSQQGRTRGKIVLEVG